MEDPRKTQLESEMKGSLSGTEEGRIRWADGGSESELSSDE